MLEFVEGHRKAGTPYIRNHLEDQTFVLMALKRCKHFCRWAMTTKCCLCLPDMEHLRCTVCLTRPRRSSG